MNIVPRSPSYIPCLKDYSDNLTKYESKGSLKIPISQLFSELAKILKYSLSNIQKFFPVFNFFH